MARNREICERYVILVYIHKKRTVDCCSFINNLKKLALKYVINKYKLILVSGLLKMLYVFELPLRRLRNLNIYQQGL